VSVTLPVLLTAAEVAKALKVSAKTVQREAADGHLQCTMVRKSMRFTEQQVLVYLERQRVNADIKPNVGSQQPPERPRHGNKQLAALRKAHEIVSKRRPQGD
jgi:excisionase family DNA binding protein